MTRHSIRDRDLGTVARLAHAASRAHGLAAPDWAARALAHGRLALTPAERAETLAQARRLAALLEAAPTDAVAEGEVWYQTARDQALAYARDLGLLGPRPPLAHWADLAQAEREARVTAAVAAASPGRDWGSNVAALGVALAHALGADLQAATAAARLSVPQTGYAPLARASRALQDGAQAALGGPKVWSFALGLLTGGRAHWVTVDGHASLAASLGPVEARPPLAAAQPMGARAYAVTAAAHALAAYTSRRSRPHGRPLTPAQAQAVVWVAWRMLPLEGRS